MIIHILLLSVYVNLLLNWAERISEQIFMCIASNSSFVALLMLIVTWFCFPNFSHFCGTKLKSKVWIHQNVHSLLLTAKHHLKLHTSPQFCTSVAQSADSVCRLRPLLEISLGNVRQLSTPREYIHQGTWASWVHCGNTYPHREHENVECYVFIYYWNLL